MPLRDAAQYTKVIQPILDKTRFTTDQLSNEIAIRVKNDEHSMPNKFYPMFSLGQENRLESLADLRSDDCYILFNRHTLIW